MSGAAAEDYSEDTSSTSDASTAVDLADEKHSFRANPSRYAAVRRISNELLQVKEEIEISMATVVPETNSAPLTRPSTH
eukprot:IDg2086t1